MSPSLPNASLRQALCTVVAIPVSPFDQDGAVDLPAYRRVIDRLITGGITVLTPNGNTSEFYSLTNDDCKRVLDATLEAVNGRALVMAGVGFDAATAGRMAREAQQSGAQAIMVHQVVHPYRSADGWVEYHLRIADAAPEAALVPYIRDNTLDAATLNALLEVCPTVAGVKYAVPDPLLFSSLAQQVGLDRLAWVCGVAESWAPFFWVGGARGFTSGLANVHPTLALGLFNALRAADFAAAREHWALAQPFEALRARQNGSRNVSVVKEALAQLGVCDRRVRPPISELPEVERAEVAAILKAWGISAHSIGAASHAGGSRLPPA